jgi:hypothetical protein
MSIATQCKGKLRFRFPLMPQWVPYGDGYFVVLLFRSPYYRNPPRQLVSREDLSDFYHSFDD